MIFIKELVVQFDKDGNMIGDYTSDAYKEEKAFDFYDKLLFIKFTRRRTSIKAHFMRMSNGKKVEMFFTDFVSTTNSFFTRKPSTIRSSSPRLCSTHLTLAPNF